jgi:predicted enzyme related to lactoylglutathione lyase
VLASLLERPATEPPTEPFITLDDLVLAAREDPSLTVGDLMVATRASRGPAPIAVSRCPEQSAPPCRKPPWSIVASMNPAGEHPRHPITPSSNGRRITPMAHGKFTWFELVTNDIDKAKTFYGETLGWTATTMDMAGFQYSALQFEGKSQAGLVAPQGGAPNHWISYLSVDDVDARARKVTEHGGKVLVPPTDIPNVGRFALVADPQGARFNLFKGTTEDGGSTRFHWNELWSPDAQAVLPFYKEVLGYAVETMQMPTGDYHVLKSADGGQGGVMTSPMPGVPAMWLPYVVIDDCDAAVARAKRMGGDVKAEANTIEGIGRLAIVGDSVGAVIGLITPPAR